MSWCNLHEAPCLRDRLYKCRISPIKTILVCRPDKACTGASPEYHLVRDPVCKLMHEWILATYSDSVRGVLTRALYTEAYKSFRTLHALPTPYRGQAQQKPHFPLQAPLALIMWPVNIELRDQTFWPQNGRLNNSEFMPVYEDAFGCVFHNTDVYFGS